MEEQQRTETEAPPAEQIPDIVKEAFGGSPKPEDKPESKPDVPAAAPSSETDGARNAPEPPPAAKPEGRESRRIQSLLSRMKTFEEQSAQSKDSKDPEEIAKRIYAEKMAEYTRQQLEEEAAKHLAEAFPGESERQHYLALAGHYAPSVVKYAPEAARYIQDSPVAYQLERAFYMVCESSGSALNDFLNYSPVKQERILRNLEATIRNGANPPPAQAFTPPASLPRGVTPSDSDSSAGKTDWFGKTIDMISKQRSGNG